MKELEKEIEIAQRRLECAIVEYQECDASDARKLEAKWHWIKRWESYLRGLEVAKECVEKGDDK